MLYQPLEITWTSVQQGSQKVAIKRNFHHATTQEERTLLFIAVHPESPQSAFQSASQSTGTSSLAKESNAEHS